MLAMLGAGGPALAQEFTGMKSQTGPRLDFPAGLAQDGRSVYVTSSRNNTINQIGFEILCVTGGAGTFNFALQLDFIYIFKELLTLPSVRQPISLRKRRNTIEIPILQREGGIQQDLGSMSWDITVGGHLISTTAGVGSWTNTYTADQWWFILNGLILESGIIAPDGNPRWQWFQSDQIQAKVLVTDYMPQQPMGRVQFWDYALQLKKFDINPETHLKDLGYAGIPGFGY